MSILSELGAYLKDNRAVKEFASSGSFPATGKINTVYVDKSTDKIYYWDGSTYAGIDAETLDGLNSTQFLRSDIDTTATGSITINNINKSLKIGDVTGDNYTEIKHTNADGYGFDFQHNNASVVLNQQGVTNEVIVLGDVDSTNGSTLFGIGHSTDSGSTWSKKLNYTGTGELYIGINGTSRAFHDGYHPNADKLTTARTISLSGDVTGTVSFDGSTNATITASVVDDSHNHIIANVDGLQSALDGKVSTNSNQALHATDALSLTGNILYLNKADGTNENVDLSLYLDDTNLSRIISGTYDSGTQELVFTRDDDSEFRIDASMFFDDTNLVTSVAGKTGAVTLVKGDVGLGNVDNTADAAKNVLSATKLTTARTIGGVSFNGTANINLPGVNTIGNQSTTGNAATATKLETARTIALSGDVSGTVSFDGSSNVTLSATVLDDSHNHIISNVDGLQTTLDGKVDKVTSTDNSVPTFNGTTGAIQNKNVMFINDSGNVGIGTNAPTQKLDVVGNIAVSGTVDGRDIAADGSKLDSIATNANNYTHPTYTYTTPVDDNETTLTTIDLLSELNVSNGHVTGGTKRNLKAGTNVSITATTDGDITIASTDTNTTYTGSKGITLSGTDFRITGNEIPGSIDLNTYRTTGFYCQNANADAASGSNYPTANAGILQVINDDYGNGVHTTQLYSQYNSTNYYHRTYYNGTWSAWRNLAQDTNTTYSAGNGMTASGTTFNVVSHAGTAGSIGTLNISADAVGVNLGTTSTTAAAGNHTHSYLPLAGGTLTGTLNAEHISIVNDSGLWIKTDTNNPTDGAMIRFSDNQSSAYAQYGWIKYKHSDGTVSTEPTTSTDGFIIGGTEANTIVSIAGHLDVDLDANIDGTLYVDGATYSPIYYDGSGTTYYLDLANTGTSLNVAGSGTFAGDLTVNGGDVSINNNNGGINFNDASKYWLKTATNWGIYWDTTNNTLEFHGAGTSRAEIDLDNGNATFSGTGNFGNDVTVDGLLTATSKSFTIPHPTKEGMKLRYGSLEGPENGVYVRGQLKGSNIIELPEYWTELVDAETITVQLTSNGSFQKLYVKDIKDNKVTIGNSSWLSNKTDCFYVVYGERKDIDKLTVEF